ncbi:MAG: hypothetical protein ABJN69_07860 [Hellea sp.]
MTVNHYSRRAAFTGAATILATLFGAAMAAYQLRGQSDLVLDVVKIAAVLAIGTACVSYAVWGLIHRKASNYLRGGLAGLLTSLLVIPLPNFVSAFKTEFLKGIKTGEAGFLIPAFDAVLPAVKTGLLTFVVLTKVSLVAVIACLCLGVIVVRCVPLAQDET